MKQSIRLLVALITLVSTAPSFAALQIFACEPEWAALARELGGNDVTIFTATTARQDPHRIEARPRLIAQARRAELLICSGAGLESGWLPWLLRQSGNARIQPGNDGYLEAAELVERLDIPATLDRTHGDLHAEGNHHVHLDPHRITLIATQLTDRLARIRKLPCLRIADYPELEWRGISDDISRGQVSTVEHFKFVIHQLAYYKKNLYQPYIEDMFRFDVSPNIGATRGAMGIDTGHYRNDGKLGIAIGNFANEMTVFYVSRGEPLLFADEAIAQGIGQATRLSLTFGVFFFDYDLDGWLDLLTANGHIENEIERVQPTQRYEQPAQLFWNARGRRPSAGFVPVPPEKSGPDLSRSP